ncbi:MAG: ubiquinol-cytochrome c reductase iron-sulfur subunit [Gemmatimonadaceae bacterium]
MPEPTRREFVRGAAGLLVGGAVAPLVSSCRGDPTRDWTFRATIDVAALAAGGDGRGLVSKTPGTDGAPILVIRIAPSHYNALSVQCTHEGCPVNAPVNGVITCPCHGSQYNLDGTVRHGPAQFALTRYLTRYDDVTHRLTVGSKE